MLSRGRLWFVPISELGRHIKCVPETRLHSYIGNRDTLKKMGIVELEGVARICACNSLRHLPLGRVGRIAGSLGSRGGKK